MLNEILATYKNTNNTTCAMLVLGGPHSLDCGATAGYVVWFLFAEVEDVDVYITYIL